MKSLLEMAKYRMANTHIKPYKIQEAEFMIADLESIIFKNTGAFDELEKDADEAINYLQEEIQELSKND